MQKGIIALVAVAVVAYVVASPDHAAHMADGAWGVVVKVAHGIGNFLDKLSS